MIVYISVTLQMLNHTKETQKKNPCKTYDKQKILAKEILMKHPRNTHDTLTKNP